MTATISIRSARQSDQKWIVDLLRTGDGSGHFRCGTEEEAVKLFNLVVNKTWFIANQERYGQIRAVFQFASIWVSEVSGLPAGFSLCTSNPEETEILVIAVKPEFQRQGCFRALVKHKINRFTSATLLDLLPKQFKNWAFMLSIKRALPDRALPLHWHWCGKGSRLFARCYPQSKIAITAFNEMGFVVTPHNGKLVELTWVGR